MRQPRRVSPRNLPPDEAWAPWSPSSADPWNLKWVGHLHRRAGFGASWSELQESLRRGFEPTLEVVLHGGDGSSAFDRLMDDLAPAAGEFNGGFVGFNGRNEPATGLQAWWIYRILHTMHPLRERMTLFWHDHFATSVAKVKNLAAMRNQNLLIRRHALGSFEPFLREMGRDPAMMVWLDCNDNVRDRPNENYARELMELFSLGVGHYTENDVRDAARAFTGWQTNAGAFRVNAFQHDDGPKTILGETGAWSGDDVVRIILAQPAAARFLVRKLYRQFVSERDRPDDALLEPLAQRFRGSNYDVADLVGTMLRSRLFFSEHAFRARIKGPVEFVAGLYRALGDPGATDGPNPQLPGQLEGLGQTLFAPPNVKGWPGGEAWINTATLLARHNLAWRAAQGPRGPLAAPFDPLALLRDQTDEPGGREAVDFLLDLLLQPGAGELADPVRANLTRFASEGNPRGPALDRRVRELTHAILTMPEYHLA